MAQIDFPTIIAIAAFGAFLWMGLYIASRIASRSILTVICFIGMLAQSYFFLLNAVTNVAQEGRDVGILISRAAWWSNCLPIAFWFHISSLVVRRGKVRSFFTPAVAFVYTIAFLLIILGTFTDLFMNYSGAQLLENNNIFIDVGPLYEYYIIFLVLTGGGAFFNLIYLLFNLRRGDDPVQRVIRLHISLLTLGAVMFLGAGLYLAVNFKYNLNLPQYPAHVALIGGLALCSYALIQYEMLLSGKAARRDFFYSFSGLVVINLFYAVPIYLVGVRSSLTLLVLVAFVTTTHTVFDFGRALMDKLFFSRDEQVARSEARDYAVTLASQPIATSEIQVADQTSPESLPIQSDEKQEIVEDITASEKAFNDAVRRAVSGLKSPPQLVKSPLLGMKIVGKRLKQSGEEDNRLNRASALKSLLTELVERLRPPGNTSYGTTDAWRFYNSLYFPYVREISKKQAHIEARRMAEERRRNNIREADEIEKVLEWLDEVDEDTFYKWQRRASNTIASILREEEQRLG